jgi:hypothetical protein
MSDDAPDIRITGGNATPEEVAAVTAVLSAALEELAGEHRRSADSRPSAWQESRRPLRGPLPFGAWRNVRG